MDSLTSGDRCTPLVGSNAATNQRLQDYKENFPIDVQPFYDSTDVQCGRGVSRFRESGTANTHQTTIRVSKRI